MTMTIEKRQAIERRIVRKLVADALKAGYALSVNDGGEELAITDSRDAKAVLAALMNTDEDYLILRQGEDKGWVRLVYGNDGWDVICDCTLNLEDVLAGVEALADQIEEREGR